jgi:hypothetical protein
MLISITGYIAEKKFKNDDNSFQFVMDRIQELIEDGIFGGHLESYPFYNIDFKVTKDD